MPWLPPSFKVGALSAAALIHNATKTPITCQEFIGAMANKKWWTSTNGKTPANTLNAALTKESHAKDKGARFAKEERGKFVAT